MKPRIAIVSNSQTPYRMHVHGRIVRELSEVELWSVFTHEFSNSPWRLKASLELRPVYLGQGEKSERQSHWKQQGAEWAKGKEVLQWIVREGVRFVLLEGYNDAGRVRVLRGCRRLGIPCFIFGDSNILADRPTALKTAIKRWIVGQADGTFYCGRLGREYFLRYGAKEASTFPFPYEPDYSMFERASPAAEQFGLRRDRRYLIYSGRFVPEKRVDLLLEAFGQMAGERPEWNLILAGDGPLREALLGALPTDIRARIVHTGFIADAANVAALYGFGDVLILPSDFEPWGVVVTEAAMSGLALVCSSVTGAGVELIRDGVNGYLFAAGDAGALREALLKVTRPENTERMKAASRGVLNEWRRVSDPVEGLRAALRLTGIVQ